MHLHSLKIVLSQTGKPRVIVAEVTTWHLRVCFIALVPDKFCLHCNLSTVEYVMHYKLKEINIVNLLARSIVMSTLF